ncbi:hypothetical protein GPECTOR_43g877 [Gonium pectorale]|uniref:Protein kinase domain-containing protein n=1 Tax=Gonium pectorale TaxID=33097 RepID=A0A150G9D5_GONPE|nr:hypothetical protein GPECTOR_43g877 [Gonium pectorale]|eukprot:KXZ46441.1 hypothetical protein GPECTOR_43g877 [Gonium pectorale]
MSSDSLHPPYCRCPPNRVPNSSRSFRASFPDRPCFPAPVSFLPRDPRKHGAWGGQIAQLPIPAPSRPNSRRQLQPHVRLSQALIYREASGAPEPPRQGRSIGSGPSSSLHSGASAGTSASAGGFGSGGPGAAACCLPDDWAALRRDEGCRHFAAAGCLAASGELLGVLSVAARGPQRPDAWSSDALQCVAGLLLPHIRRAQAVLASPALAQLAAAASFSELVAAAAEAAADAYTVGTKAYPRDLLLTRGSVMPTSLALATVAGPTGEPLMALYVTYGTLLPGPLLAAAITPLILSKLNGDLQLEYVCLVQQLEEVATCRKALIRPGADRGASCGYLDKEPGDAAVAAAAPVAAAARGDGVPQSALAAPPDAPAPLSAEAGQAAAAGGGKAPLDRCSLLESPCGGGGDSSGGDSDGRGPDGRRPGGGGGGRGANADAMAADARDSPRLPGGLWRDVVRSLVGPRPGAGGEDCGLEEGVAIPLRTQSEARNRSVMTRPEPGRSISFRLEAARSPRGASKLAPLIASMHDRLKAAQAAVLTKGRSDSLKCDIRSLKLLQEIGRGGYGTVYRGTYYGAEVAVKFIPHSRLASVKSGGHGRSTTGPCDSGGNTTSALGLHKQHLHDAIELVASVSMSHTNIVQVPGYFLDVRLSMAEQQALDPFESLDLPSLPCPVGLEYLPSLLESPGPGVDIGGLCEGAGMALVLEYCDAGSLCDAIVGKKFIERVTPRAAPGAPPSTKSYAAINMRYVYLTLLEIALALRHMHSLAIVHCDLKPQNVLLKSSPRDPRGFTAKLSDFGLAKMMAHDDKGQLVIDEAVASGTITHVAPEVLLGQEPVGAAVDVYAFGILMYQIVCGMTVYGSVPTAAQIATEVVHSGMRPRLPAWVPSVYRALAEACWQREPSARPTSEELVQQLERAIETKMGLGRRGGIAGSAGGAAAASSAAAPQR